MTRHGVDGRNFAPPSPAEVRKTRQVGENDEKEMTKVTAPLFRVSGVVGSALRKLGLHLEGQDPLHQKERRRVIRSLFHEGERLKSFFVRFSSLMALAATIAALGLISDSTAVVIGAMLVAPMMTPVLGMAAAVVMAWPVRIIRQSALVGAGAIISILLAFVISLVIPGHPLPLPEELIARTSPNLLDLGIALAAGAAGAYGQVRRQASDALPGVAVAVALVPPLATVGITLQLGEWQMALGALFLFLVNVAGIVASASLTLILCGFVPGRRLLTGNRSIASGLRWLAVGLIILVMPMQFGRGNVLPPTDHTSDVIAAVEEFVEMDNGMAEVVDVSVSVEGDTTDVNVVLVASPLSTPPITALADHLADRLETSVDVTMQVVTTSTNRAAISSIN